jgi:thiol-disulfide isomerase/thioredoxin
VRRLLALALAATLALGGCGGESGGSGGSAGGLGALVEMKAADRKPAPDISGQLLDGGQFAMDSVRGQVLVVNFWASWCAPCRAEATDLEAVYQATRTHGVTFLGINVRDDRDRAKAFHAGRTSYPSIFDPAGRLALSFKDVPPNTIPATLVVDRNGKLAVVIRTAITKSTLQPIVDRIAADG